MAFSIVRRSLIAAIPALALATPAMAQRTRNRRPETEAAIRDLQARRWSALSQRITSPPPQSAHVLIRNVADAAPLGADLDGLAEQPSGHTMLAAIAIAWAWRYRGTGTGSTVTAEGGQAFAQQLASARAHLDAAIAANPDDGSAHALGFEVAKGMGDQLALATGLRPFLMAARRPVGGLSAYATAISRKWLGSEEMTLGFARQVYRIDLPASAAVLGTAHLESWSSRAMAAGPAGGGPALEDYLENDGARADILTANEAFNSVELDPDPQANWYANGWLSYLLYAMGEPNLARPHIVAMGEHISGPWSQLDQADVLLDGVRRELGLSTL